MNHLHQYSNVKQIYPGREEAYVESPNVKVKYKYKQACACLVSSFIAEHLKKIIDDLSLTTICPAINPAGSDQAFYCVSEGENICLCQN